MEEVQSKCEGSAEWLKHPLIPPNQAFEPLKYFAGPVRPGGE